MYHLLVMMKKVKSLGNFMFEERVLSFLDQLSIIIYVEASIKDLIRPP